MNTHREGPSRSDRALGAVLLFAMAAFAWFLATWALLGGGGDSAECTAQLCGTVWQDASIWVAAGWPLLAALVGAIVFLRRWARGATVGWVPVVWAGVAFAGWLVAVGVVWLVTGR